MKVVIYNKNLNPEFWDDNKQLRPEIRTALLKIGNQFWKDIELKMHIRDILFLGSSANYNWTPISDCDLHLLVDFNDLPMPSEMAKQYVKTLVKKWNEESEVRIKGHKVEVYIQDIAEENRSTGVFSLLHNKWIKEASPQNIVLNKNLIQSKYTTWVRRINIAISSQNSNKLKKVMDDLVKMREIGLTTTGEFSTENIVFKILRQRNVISKLKSAIQNLKNKDLSLREKNNQNILNESRISGITLNDIVKSTIGDHSYFRMYDDIDDYKRWVWQSGSDEIAWWESPTLHEKEITADYIHKKYGKLIWKHTGGMKETSDSKTISVKDAFDPTSFGPNPAATIGLSLSSSDGGFDKDFYQRNISQMRKL